MSEKGFLVFEVQHAPKRVEEQKKKVLNDRNAH